MPKKQSQKSVEDQGAAGDLQALGDKLISWYLVNQRELPWRSTQNPYFIWLSEVILQQTRVVQGLPYYLIFVERYPSVQDLAGADEREVLRTWQGLGYYSRARNMHQTARQVVEELGGEFPATFSGLLQLKGIGPYTAAAIASFAFGEEVAVVDGNVFRVLSRLFGITTDISGGGAREEFRKIAESLMPPGKSALFNQAMMEFGAMHCKPVSPDCGSCIFRLDCYAQKGGLQQALPVKLKKTKQAKRFLNYFVFEFSGMIAMRERKGNDIWKGLFDFYLLETDRPADTADLIEEDQWLLSAVSNGEVSEGERVFVHLLTHQRLEIRFHRVFLKDDCSRKWPVGLQWYSLAEVEHLPKPVVISQFLETLMPGNGSSS